MVTIYLFTFHTVYLRILRFVWFQKQLIISPYKSNRLVREMKCQGSYKKRNQMFNSWLDEFRRGWKQFYFCDCFLISARPLCRFEVPRLRQFVQFCFPLRVHSTAVSIIPPMLWNSMLLHLVSRKQGGWKTWKQSSSLRMSWSSTLKDVFTLYVESLITNPVFNSYVNSVHFAWISDKITRCKNKPVSKFLPG